MTGTCRHHKPGILFPMLLMIITVSLACSTSQFLPATETPLPSATNTPVPPTDTPEPTPTMDLVATGAARATDAFTAKMLEMEELLSEYEIELPPGHMLWEQLNEITILEYDYRIIRYDRIAPGITAKNIILYTKITWSSTTGLAGCGIIIRSEKDMVDGKHYLFRTTRLSGSSPWRVEYWDKGKRVNNPSGEFKYTKVINLDQGSKNEYVLVVIDNELTIYANGSRLGRVMMTALDEGRLGIAAWQESGETECTFNDTWLWRIDK